MSRKRLMSQIILACQRRADMEGNDVISPPEWQALISEQYAKLYSTVVKSGMRYFESVQTITANGSVSYALPEDHDETIGVDRIIDTEGRKIQLGEFMIQERNAWSGQTSDAVAYSVVGQTLKLFPRPLGGTYEHVYVPQSPDLSNVSAQSEVDLVTGDGEALMYYGVAIKAMSKTEADVTVMMRERDIALVDFTEDCGMRALVNPRRRIVMSTVGTGGMYGSDEYGLAGDPAGWWNR